MSIDFNGNPDISLLPKEIVLLMTAFKETPRWKETTQGMQVRLCHLEYRANIYIGVSVSKKID